MVTGSVERAKPGPRQTTSVAGQGHAASRLPSGRSGPRPDAREYLRSQRSSERSEPPARAASVTGTSARMGLSRRRCEVEEGELLRQQVTWTARGFATGSESSGSSARLPCAEMREREAPPRWRHRSPVARERQLPSRRHDAVQTGTRSALRRRPQAGRAQEPRHLGAPGERACDLRTAPCGAQVPSRAAHLGGPSPEDRLFASASSRGSAGRGASAPRQATPLRRLGGRRGAPQQRGRAGQVSSRGKALADPLGEPAGTARPRPSGRGEAATASGASETAK